jgi:phosphatidylinositol dimannoside acyltransferase
MFGFQRFAVRGVLWRNYLDWAVIHVPFPMYPVLEFFWSLFFFVVAAPARRAILANLSVVHPGLTKSLNRLRAFRVFHNYAWTITEAAIRKINKQPFTYQIEGEEWLEQLGVARGAVVLTAHMGSYDLGAAVFAEKFNREIRMVRALETDPQSAQHLDTSLARSSEGGVKVDYTNSSELLSLDLLQALRSGEIVSIQGDRAVNGPSSVPAQLFGKRMQLPSGPFVLAQAAQVPIYPLFIARSGYRRYQVIVHEPITVQRNGLERKADIAPAVEKWRLILEQQITKNWDQWFAFTPAFQK